MCCVPFALPVTTTEYDPAGVPEFPVEVVVVVVPPPPQATWNAHPLRTRKIRQKPNSFLRFGLLSPAPPSNIAGTISASANIVPEPFCPAGVASAACGPAVVTVSLAVPTLFATEIAPTAHVAAGVVAGVTLQLRATVDGFSPPTAVTVTLELADEPGATEGGDRVPADRLKPGAVTIKFSTGEVLMR